MVFACCLGSPIPNFKSLLARELADLQVRLIAEHDAAVARALMDQRHGSLSHGRVQNAPSTAAAEAMVNGIKQENARLEEDTRYQADMAAARAQIVQFNGQLRVAQAQLLRLSHDIEDACGTAGNVAEVDLAMSNALSKLPVQTVGVDTSMGMDVIRSLGSAQTIMTGIAHGFGLAPLSPSTKVSLDWTGDADARPEVWDVRPPSPASLSASCAQKRLYIV